MNYISEHTLEKLFLTPDALSEQEKQDIQSHVSECSLCKERWDTLNAFYADLQERLDSPPTERDRAFAERLMARRRLALPSRAIERRSPSEIVENAFETYAEVIEPYRRSLPQRFVRYVQMYPVRFAGTTSLIAAALVLSILFFRPTKDSNPTHARIQNSVLYVYNKQGEVLWSKGAMGLPDYSSHLTVESQGVDRQFLLLTDIDGDGKREVVQFGLTIGGTFATDTAYCFNYDGTLRWKAGCGSILQFGDQDFTAQGRWGLGTMFVMKRAVVEKPRLFAIAQVLPYWPSKIFELDPKDGRELQSYWHAGGLGFHAISADVNADGLNEIVIGGINNAYPSACLVVLDPLKLSGCGPTISTWRPENLPPGSEMYYVLLPRTDMNIAAAPAIYPTFSQLTAVARDRFLAYTQEAFGIKHEEPGGGILYTFGSGMKIESIVAGDNFIKSHERLQQQGKLTKKLGPAYYQELRDSIKYWDGERSRFVSYDELRKPNQYLP